MKPTTSRFLALVLFATTFIVAFGRINYDGVALTSIDVKKKPGTENIVTFSGSISGSASDKTATFLHKIKQINDKDEGGKRLFQAETLTTAEAKKIINEGGEDRNGGKPLFCIHGFTVQPGNFLKNMNNLNKNKFTKGKFLLVPVIWPSSKIDYRNDSKAAEGAGKAFKTLKKEINSFPSKSLLCHSMGARVLRHAANADFKFDNIFMVAADIRHDIFHKNYIRGNDGDEKEDGLRICSMLSNRNKGKVHVLYNGADFALNFSGWYPKNWISRLGSVSNGQEKTWWGGWRKADLTDPEIKGSVLNKACNPHLTNKLSHSYQFNNFAIKYYQEHHF